MRWAVVAGALLLTACTGVWPDCAAAYSCPAGIRVENRFYDTVHRAAEKSALGNPIATIIGDYCVPCESPTAGPGEALGIGVGGKVYAVLGYRMSFRVATIDDDHVQLYEANDPRIRSGKDIFALAGKVATITTRTAAHRRHVISNPGRIARIVRGIEASPVVRPHRAPAHGSVTFVLRDGGRIEIHLAARTRVLDRRLLLSPDVVHALTPTG